MKFSLRDLQAITGWAQANGLDEVDIEGGNGWLTAVYPGDQEIQIFDVRDKRAARVTVPLVHAKAKPKGEVQ